MEFGPGDAISIPSEEEEEEEGEDADAPPRRLALVMRLFAGKDGEAKVTARVLERGANTVLGSLASKRELFVSTEVLEYSLAEVIVHKPSIIGCLLHRTHTPRAALQLFCIAASPRC